MVELQSPKSVLDQFHWCSMLVPVKKGCAGTSVFAAVCGFNQQPAGFKSPVVPKAREENDVTMTGWREELRHKKRTPNPR